MLSITTEYALRALAYLAAQPQGEPVRSRELAQKTSIPASYLSKILHSLRTAGFLRAARGVGGGYSLDRPPSRIHLIEIAELFEGPQVIPQCLLYSDHECSERNPCTAHAEWRTVRQAMVDVLERTTVRDISGLPAARPAEPAKGDPR